MFDLRPVGYVIGMVVAVLGGMMLFPMMLDLAVGNPNWTAFLQSAAICLLTGTFVALGCGGGRMRGLNLQQTFLLTVMSWVAASLFGALPLVLGAPGVGLTDALFESTSGLTTTGTTVLTGLEGLPPGVNLWRAMLQWLGGLGIVIVAMIFLPVMKVGGMQFFRSEGFDTLGKVLPRALDISSALIQVYVFLTLACALTFFALGMSGHDAVLFALTAVSTGGFAPYDASFGVYIGPPEWAAAVFMLLASMPFVRFIQIMQGQPLPLWRDPQVRAYLRWNLYAMAAVACYEIITRGAAVGSTLRETVFNIASIFSGTGYTSVDLSLWGPFPFVVLMAVGLIGGCTSSTGCSIKVFRFLILFEAVKVQVLRLVNPSAVLSVRYDSRRVDREVIDSVIVFFTLFILTFGVMAVALSLTGLSTRAALTGAWTAVANVGPVFGPEVAPSGAVTAFPPMAKWLMIFGMILGRLELLAVYVLFLRSFWRS